MKFETPITTILYAIEATTKSYRRLSLHNISNVVSDITIDQALILTIVDSEDKTQSEIADLAFKDYASMTRIVKLMLNKNYLTKSIDGADRRKVKLKITKKGKNIVEQLKPIIKKNREIALSLISDKELRQFSLTLIKITQNCKIHSK